MNKGKRYGVSLLGLLLLIGGGSAQAAPNRPISQPEQQSTPSAPVVIQQEQTATDYYKGELRAPQGPRCCRSLRAAAHGSGCGRFSMVVAGSSLARWLGLRGYPCHSRRARAAGRVVLRHCERQRSNPVAVLGSWIASSRSLLAMTRPDVQRERTCSFTSPRRAGRGRSVERSETVRVRRRCRESEPGGNAPSPRPSPRTRGEGGREPQRLNKVHAK